MREIEGLLNIDLIAATQAKFLKVEEKYPIEKSIALAKKPRGF